MHDKPITQDIVHGNATLPATGTGWALPGGREVKSINLARMYARRMARMMTKLEVRK